MKGYKKRKLQNNYKITNNLNKEPVTGFLKNLMNIKIQMIITQRKEMLNLKIF